MLELKYAKENEDFPLFFVYDNVLYGFARIEKEKTSTVRTGFIRIRRDCGKRSTLAAHIFVREDEIVCQYGYIDGRCKKGDEKHKPIEHTNRRFDTLKAFLKQYNVSEKNIERLEKYIEVLKEELKVRNKEGYDDIKDLKSIMRRLNYSEEYIEAVLSNRPINLVEPHGRLADIDKFLHDSGLEKAKKYGSEDRNYSYSTMMMYEIADMIDDMPVVMKATNEDTKI